jgi:hypothetical protein
VVGAPGRAVAKDHGWPNIVEEIEAMGRSELRQCESLLIQALVHLLKCRAWPESQAVRHWMTETVGFLSAARRAFTLSMRQRIDLPDLYAEALELVGVADDESGAPRALPSLCPFALDDLLARPPAVASLVAALETAAS